MFSPAMRVSSAHYASVSVEDAALPAPLATYFRLVLE